MIGASSDQGLPANAKIKAARILNNGKALFSAAFTGQTVGAGSFTASTGQTVTVNAPAALQ